VTQPEVETQQQGEEEEEEARELRKEAFTMALYVAICLLAALSVVSEHGGTSEADTFKIVWGTTLGLALAHWFAFRVSSRLVAQRWPHDTTTYRNIRGPAGGVGRGERSPRTSRTPSCRRSGRGSGCRWSGRPTPPSMGSSRCRPSSR
jgi:hypothetical protein